MNLYGEFARFYSKGDWTRYSRRMAEKLPQMLAQLGRDPSLLGVSLLDLACGEGTFACEMAASGALVKGIDRSESMLALAREKSAEAGMEVGFLAGDIRGLPFGHTPWPGKHGGPASADDAGSRFDLVTCWNDSLNYLLTPEDLSAAFRTAAEAMRPDGLFLFDMNTIYGLAVVWQRIPAQVEMETSQMMVVRRSAYDFELSIATMYLTCFERDDEAEGAAWHRADEIPRERGYTLEEIRSALSLAGLAEIACWGRIEAWRPPEATDGRVWFAAHLKIPK
jgi:SAM-dependent methyltransferase